MSDNNDKKAKIIIKNTTERIFHLVGFDDDLMKFKDFYKTYLDSKQTCEKKATKKGKYELRERVYDYYV